MTAAAPPADTLKAPSGHVQRFAPVDRLLHVLLMTAFLGLSFTGLPLQFADTPWGVRLAGLMGGYGVTGVLHRLCALLLIACFVTHLLRVFERVYRRKERGLLWGPDSLVPQPRDLVQMEQHFRWFLGRGPRPHFDRFTYWEKFDYWAVFWGMGVIGFSGLMLWFPTVFSRVLPGWLFNVAMVVHGEEALLAVVFIFTVHFFNGHLRPEKFPMDTVIFTGQLTVDELKHERPAEYERLAKSGGLEALLVPEASPALRRGARVLGTVAVGLGFVMVTLIVWALLRT